MDTPCVIEIVNNELIVLHFCENDAAAKKLYKRICIATVDDAKDLSQESWEEHYDSGIMYLNGDCGSVCLHLTN
jgi:hypothetical protein